MAATPETFFCEPLAPYNIKGQLLRLQLRAALCRQPAATRINWELVCQDDCLSPSDAFGAFAAEGTTSPPTSSLLTELLFEEHTCSSTQTGNLPGKAEACLLYIIEHIMLIYQVEQFAKSQSSDFISIK